MLYRNEYDEREVIELWMRGSHSKALNWHAPSHQRDDQTIVARELEPDRVQGDAEDKRTQFAHLLPLLVIDIELQNIQHSLGILRSMCKQTSRTLSTDREYGTEKDSVWNVQCDSTG